MNAKKTLIVMWIWVCGLFVSCPGASAWQAKIADGWFNVVAVDVTGNVVAAGATFDAYGSSVNFIVAKFDGVSGQELWRRIIHGTANATGSAHAVAVDAAGDVVAAGSTVNTGTFSDFTVIKFDGASGQERWRKVIDGNANIDDWANAVAVDAAGLQAVAPQNAPPDISHRMPADDAAPHQCISIGGRGYFGREILAPAEGIVVFNGDYKWSRWRNGSGAGGGVRGGLRRELP